LRHWGPLFFLLLAVAVALVLFIYRSAIYQAYVIRSEILADYRAQQKCLRVDPDSLPAVRISGLESTDGTVAGCGGTCEELVEFKSADQALQPVVPSPHFDLAIPNFHDSSWGPFSCHYANLLVREAKRPDGVKRLVSVYTANNQLNVEAWTIATLLQPARQTTDVTDLVELIPSPGQSITVHGISDPAGPNRLLLHVAQEGSVAASGDFELILHNDDTITCRPSFGWNDPVNPQQWHPVSPD
jgi:hypothetical protein